MLDDKSIDAVVIATPQHQHALNFVPAIQAGKDVYQEYDGLDLMMIADGTPLKILICVAAGGHSIHQFRCFLQSAGYGGGKGQDGRRHRHPHSHVAQRPVRGLEARYSR